MQSRSTQPAPISAPLQHDAALDGAAPPDGDALPQHDEAADVRVRVDPAAALDDGGRDDAAVDHARPRHRQEAAPEALRHRVATLPSMMSKVPWR